MGRRNKSMKKWGSGGEYGGVKMTKTWVAVVVSPAPLLSLS